MAAVSLSLKAIGEVSPMADQTASGSETINIEITPTESMIVDVAITKPVGAVLTVFKKYGLSGALVPQIVSADATAATSVEVLDVVMAFGDTLLVDIDATSGNKTVSAQGRRLRC